MKVFIYTFQEKIDGIIEILNDNSILQTLDPSDCDFILAIGGDGTVLKAAEVALDYDKKLIGYNVGSVGFLTMGNDLNVICKALLCNDFVIDRRDVLYLRTYKTDPIYALNEIVVSNKVRNKLLDLRLTINQTGESISYQADSVIFSTSTGSTAYNLSAGGAIVHPSIRCILITPIAPFSMAARPIILPGEFTIDIQSNTDTLIVVDGVKNFIIKKFDKCNIQYNYHFKKRVKLVKLNNNFIYSIKNKLGWGNIIKK